MYRLFIIEDDPGIASSLLLLAQNWGFEAEACKDFRSVADEAEAFDPQLVLLDIKLPFFNGYHWCSELRKRSGVPIIIISSASDSMNIVMAMNMGADDFIAKPFDTDVLMAKIQALLRRTYDYAAVPAALSYKGIFLSTSDTVIEFEGRKTELTKNEYRILTCLFEAKGKPVSRERLMEKLWETDSFIDDNTLTVNVNRLRKTLDGIGLHDFIKTKIGFGYCLE